jgi:TonB family protein
VKKKMYLTLLFWLTVSCLGQTVCPKHIETPTYPVVAAMARVQGRIVLHVTLDAEGKITKVEIPEDVAHSTQPILQDSAIDSMKRWTFEKPPSGPVTQVIIYEYKMDPSLPPISDHQGPMTKVLIDLPDHVTILHNESVANPAQSRKKPKSSAR